jgi:hypothetical protein
MRNALILGLPIAFLIFDSTAEALVIKPNYSKLGSVYQDNDGLIYTAPGAGRVDVTADIKANIETVIAAWQNAILIPAWTEEVTFTIGKPSKADRAGETTLSGAVDGNMRPTSAQTILDDSADTKWFIDKTPNDNSEFDKIQLEYSMGPETGGKETNVARYAAAVDRGPADHKLDLLQ